MKVRYLTMLLLMTASLLFATNPDNNENTAAKTKLFTLEKGAIIDYTETTVSFIGGKQNLFLVYSVNDEANGTYYSYVVVNDKKYGPYDYVSAMNFSKTTGNFHFAYYTKDAYYMNVNGTVTGPFTGFPEIMQINEYKNYAVFSYEADGWYIWHGGKKYGPSEEFDLPVLSANGTMSYSYGTGGKRYANVNGKNYGPYDYLYNLSVTDNGAGFFFMYGNGTESYYNYNGKSFGPYATVGAGGVNTERGGYFATYTDKNGKGYIDLNGKINGPYISEPFCYYLMKGFVYATVEKEANKFYILTEKSEAGPYASVVFGTGAESGTGYAVAVAKTDGKLAVVHNGKELPGIDNLQAVTCNYDGSEVLYFGSGADSKFYVYVNGTKYGPFEEMYGGDMMREKNNKGWYIHYLEGGKQYAVINGNKVGPFGNAEVWNMKFSSGGGYMLPYTSDDYTQGFVMVNGKTYPLPGAYSIYTEISGSNWAIVSVADTYQLTLNGKNMGANTFAPSLTEKGGHYLSIEGDTLYLNTF